MLYTIKAFSNCEQAFIVWQPEASIDGCLGFALYRKLNGGQPAVLDTWLGFEGDFQGPGTHRPSTHWPVQKLLWSDYLVKQDDVVSYRVVPVLGTPGHLQEHDDLGSDWTEPVTITAATGGTMRAFFNRGILASQWVTRMLGGGPATLKEHTLEGVLTDSGSALRKRLAGPLREEMLRLLQSAEASGDVYAALFELNDPELLAGLLALGPRAHVILANGAPGAGQKDENADARSKLKDGGVEVLDRMLPSRHLGHNKFAVFCDPAGQPQQVWTGSTNWTMTGLCTQVNNGLLIDDPQIAQVFRDQWERLKTAGSKQTPELKSANNEKKTAQSGVDAVSIWFSPEPQANGTFAELEDARSLITAAHDGILFLMFIPGWEGSLLQTIQGYAADRPDLYVRGAVNQDPGGTNNSVIGLFNRGQWHTTNMDVVLPAAMGSGYQWWEQELLKLPSAHAMVHSKVIVLDAFGDHPVVITGSHNLGRAASQNNDENLLIIQGNADLARAYAVNIMAVYNQYSWRYHQSVPDKIISGNHNPLSAAPDASASSPPDPQPAAAAGHTWKNLRSDDTWQDPYFTTGPDQRELRFWLGGG